MCGKVYVYKFNLERHALSCRGAPGVVCRMCDMRFKSYKELYVHRKRNHPIDDPSNLQKEPWGNENEAPWYGMEDTHRENIEGIYNLHRGSILAPNHVSDVVSVYNLLCLNSITTHDIVQFVKEIYAHAQHTLKISFAAGLILQNIITEEFRYWRPYQSQEFFSDAFTISSYKDIDKLKDKLDRFDIDDYCMKQRLDKKYRCVLITQIQMFVFETPYTLGSELVKLPSYLTNNRYIVCLDKKRVGTHKILYKDNLCAFRCLPYHTHPTLYETNPIGFEMLTLTMFKRWQNYMLEHHKETLYGATFKGVGSD